MREPMKRTIFLLLTLIAAAGCSREPSAKDFERFARQYAEFATKTPDNEPHRLVELSRHDLRRTDSLTVPFVGEAVYDVTLKNVPFAHPDVPGFETTSIYRNRATVLFGYESGEWKPQGGEVVITGIELPEVDEATRKAVGKAHNDNREDLPPDVIADGRIGLKNVWGVISADEAKAMRPTTGR